MYQFQPVQHQRNWHSAFSVRKDPQGQRFRYNHDAEESPAVLFRSPSLQLAVCRKVRLSHFLAHSRNKRPVMMVWNVQKYTPGRGSQAVEEKRLLRLTLTDTTASRQES